MPRLGFFSWNYGVDDCWTSSRIPFVSRARRRSSDGMFARGYLQAAAKAPAVALGAGGRGILLLGRVSSRPPRFGELVGMMPDPRAAGAVGCPISWGHDGPGGRCAQEEGLNI